MADPVGFNLERLKGPYPFDEVLFVVVWRRAIKATWYSELKSGASVKPTDRKYLGYQPGLEAHAERIVAFCKFATQFFEGVA